MDSRIPYYPVCRDVQNVKVTKDRKLIEPGRTVKNFLGGLTFKYLGHNTNFNKVFQDFFSQLDRFFKQDFVFQLNHKQISLLDYLKAMFSFKHPDSLCIRVFA
jgi:hypothetical protein